MIRTVIYARYSCDRQNEASIEGQLRECQEYATRNEFTIVGTYIDRALTGTNDNREQFQKMISDGDKGLFDIVLMYKMDRFARNRYDSAVYKARLKKNGIRVLYAKENIPDGPEGIILESLLEGLAEYYSAELSQKIKRGLKENALNGRTTGGRGALGFMTNENRQLVVDEKTAPIVQRIYALYDKGVAVTEICEELNQKGFKTSTGSRFNKNSLWVILKNEKYLGVYTAMDTRIENCFPAIIDKDLYERVQKRLAQNSLAPGRGRAKVDYLLSGKLFCGKCGSGMVGESGTSKSGDKHNYYICAKKKREKACDKKTVRKEWVEQLVVEMTAVHILQPERIELIAKRCVEIQNSDNGQHVQMDLLKKQLAETEKAIQNLISAMEQGIVSKSTKARLIELEAAQEQLEHEITVCSVATPKLTEREVRFLLSQFIRETDEPMEEYSRNLLDSLVSSVHLHEDKLIVTYNLLNKEKTELESSVLQFVSDALCSDTRVIGGGGGEISEHLYFYSEVIILAVPIKKQYCKA